jgi:hypothetical protein
VGVKVTTKRAGRSGAQQHIDRDRWFASVGSSLIPSSQSKAPSTAAEDGASDFCLFSALLRGGLGFAAVSVAGFAVWAFGGKWLEARAGEAGLYLACMIVFIATSGLVLHPLVRGPRSWARFYKIFLPAFGVYAVGWSAAWFLGRFGLGEWLGSLAGSFLLTVMIARGLGNYRSLVKVSVAMFVLHSAGYFLGGRSMGWLMHWAKTGAMGGYRDTVAKLCWGLIYGLGVGAGLGYAFFTFQAESPTAAPCCDNRRPAP